MKGATNDPTWKMRWLYGAIIGRGCWVTRGDGLEDFGSGEELSGVNWW